ncbi:hypothetical protein [Janthinobacterium sp. B9-8]|uniref:hypothetical protein n=1 Tax=Janthinobacterium sp. B9-8 TaxID=1236179 RepID=UPI00061D0ADB|nr:hypothetical protein [Janthinobacterium sp. B9-8]AMC34758.1 hypothetical protein VN23_09120 [Janthinobacterium sp. B9-8]
MKQASLLIRDALTFVSQKEVALTMGVDEGAVTKMVHNQQGVKISQLDAFLSVLRLRLIPEGQVVVSEEKYRAMKCLARAYVGIAVDLSPDAVTQEVRQAATLLVAEWLTKEACSGCASNDSWALASLMSGQALQDTVGFQAKVKS